MNSSNFVVPKVAEHRLFDLLSDKTSNETKLNAARWYLEMMIHEFFSMEAVNKYGTKFHELTLHKKIEVLQEFYDADLILLMNKIRVCGNQGAHYNLSLDLSNEEIKELVDQALGLFEYLLIKWFEINTIIKTEYTARIFSTIYLNVRIRVLEKLILIEKNNKNCQHENLMTLFHKYIIALVKSDRKNDAIQFFKDLHASGRININRSDYNKYIKSIDRLENGKKKVSWPLLTICLTVKETLTM